MKQIKTTKTVKTPSKEVEHIFNLLANNYKSFTLDNLVKETLFIECPVSIYNSGNFDYSSTDFSVSALLQEQVKNFIKIKENEEFVVSFDKEDTVLSDFFSKAFNRSHNFLRNFCLNISQLECFIDTRINTRINTRGSKNSSKNSVFDDYKVSIVKDNNSLSDLIEKSLKELIEQNNGLTFTIKRTHDINNFRSSNDFVMNLKEKDLFLDIFFKNMSSYFLLKSFEYKKESSKLPTNKFLIEGYPISFLSKMKFKNLVKNYSFFMEKNKDFFIKEIQDQYLLVKEELKKSNKTNKSLFIQSLLSKQSNIDFEKGLESINKDNLKDLDISDLYLKQFLKVISVKKVNPTKIDRMRSILYKLSSVDVLFINNLSNQLSKEEIRLDIIHFYNLVYFLSNTLNISDYNSYNKKYINTPVFENKELFNCFLSGKRFNINLALDELSTSSLAQDTETYKAVNFVVTIESVLKEVKSQSSNIVLNLDYSFSQKDIYYGNVIVDFLKNNVSYLNTFLSNLDLSFIETGMLNINIKDKERELILATKTFYEQICSLKEFYPRSEFNQKYYQEFFDIIDKLL